MALSPVPDTGAFTRRNQSIINSNFQALTNPDLWVRPQYGVNATADGTYEKPFATMAGAFGSPLFRPGVVIGVLGVLFEQVSTPIVNDITVVGMADQPRQATTSGAANGGGATWLSPSSATGPLITVNGQGWRFQNLFFNNSDTTTACVALTAGGDPPATADAGHASFLGCKFTGACYGISDSAGEGFVTIDGCTFFGFAGSGDTAIVGLSISNALPLGWVITNNNFYGNVHNLVLASSNGVIAGNTFQYIGYNGVTSTSLVNLTGGKNNAVYNNKFCLASDTAGIGTTILKGGTNDSWGPNFYSDVTEYGLPTS